MTDSRRFYRAMSHSTLGPSRQTFGPNLRILVVLLVIGFLFSGLAYAVAHEIRDRTAWIVFNALTVGFGVTIVGSLASRAWLHDGGISYRSIFGYGEVRWEEIEWIYYGAADLQAHWIPLGKLERLKLVTREQRKVSFGGNIQNASMLYEAASQKTFDRLYGRAVEEFNSGTELSFGSIRVTPSLGIIIQKWLVPKTILWREIAGFQADEYFVSFDRVAKHFAVRVATERVANVRVLHLLLMGAMKHVW